MIDFDAIWRFQDEVRTEVNACLGDCVWDLSYNPIRQCITYGSMFVIYP